MTSSWNETTLPTILSNYKCLPDKTYHFKGEKCSGRKKSRVKGTGMEAASATGKKLPIFIRGKSKNPCYFKSVKHLPCQYVAQKKSWMNSQNFENWVRKLDQKYRVNERKIALIIDNCSAHPSIPNLTNIELVFLHPPITNTHQHYTNPSDNEPRCHQIP